ncbi:response regulator [Oceanisphaera arctica]|uniref:Response regulatory domain-containing protein n=1 Tax=Oceanisphaera arctica TaxID=641510 RepID=A0A2P5TPR4_9GAMM|nr:response regulator [Oceanisphaera arctica]PPL17683.1 hypothetical protein UN63_03695 [Oceanisphaera arctica]GHA18733.1 hypothetical protein GCM10007082_19200 [Oceanisphaera arctica]
MPPSGEQGMTLFREQRPDIILLNVVMPGLSGHEVCRRLKAEPETRDIPVIFVTSQSQEAEEVLGFEIGAVDFITKPINPVIVSARVRTHLALKQQSDMLRSLAMLNSLTKVANRRKFDEELSLSCRSAVAQLSLSWRAASVKDVRCRWCCWIWTISNGSTIYTDIRKETAV